MGPDEVLLDQVFDMGQGRQRCGRVQPCIEAGIDLS